MVFLPDIARDGRKDNRAAVWNEQLGPLVKLPLRPGSEKVISGLDLHSVISEAEEQAERIRLLYVATTRAADYLALSAGTFLDELEKPTAPWLKLLSERFDLQTGACRTTLPDGYATPAAKITTDAPTTSRPSVASPTQGDLEQALDKAAKLSRNQSVPEVDDPWSRFAEPVLADPSAQRRFSVSRLNGELRLKSDATAFAAGAADDDDLPTSRGAAADLGTLVHQVLARVKFDGPSNVAAIVRQCAEAAGGEADEHVAPAEKMIEEFMQSDRARQIAVAKAIYRELEFLLAWPPHSAGRLYLQGFIDCLYQDAQGKWHLLDYKTNRVAPDAVETAAKPYQMQLGVYALAVEHILGQPPVELVVSFLRPAAEHRFEWNDALRQRTAEQVTMAIDAARGIRH